MFFIKDLIIIDREHYPYDLGNANILDYASIYVKKYIDPITSIIFLLVVLLPIELLKDYKLKKGVKYSFTVKWFISIVVIMIPILLWGLFTNIWVVPWWKNLYYVVFSILFGLGITSILHLFVDRYSASK